MENQSHIVLLKLFKYSLEVQTGSNKNVVWVEVGGGIIAQDVELSCSLYGIRDIWGQST